MVKTFKNILLQNQNFKSLGPDIRQAVTGPLDLWFMYLSKLFQLFEHKHWILSSFDISGSRLYLSCVMRKSTFCICENKDADQLHSDHEADQRLCFRYIDRTIPLLSKSEISSLLPSPVAVQPGLCRTRSETRMLVFS